MSITALWARGVEQHLRAKFFHRRKNGRLAHRFRPAPLEKFEERVVPSGVNFILNEAVPNTLIANVTASTWTEDGTNPDIFRNTITNNSGASVVVGVGVYQDQGTTSPVDLASQVFLMEQDFTIPAATTLNPTTTITVTVASPNCIQLDAFLKSGTATNGNTFIAYANSFFTQGDQTTPGPEIDAGFNVYGMSGGAYKMHNYHSPTGSTSGAPSDIKGTLIAVAQTDGPCTTPSITGGDSATIGWWQNPNGQKMIQGSGSFTGFALTADGHTAGQWLAATLPNLFSSSQVTSFGVSYTNLTSSNPATSDTALALLYKNVFKNGGSPKVLAQILDLALSAFATSSVLNTSTADQAFAQSHGFNISVSGTGIKDVDIGTTGQAALEPGFKLIPPPPNGVMGMGANGTSYSVLTILEAADRIGPAGLTSAINDVFDTINSNNDISG